METYCIVPYRRTYRVEAISADGAHRVLDVWYTEEAVVFFKLGLTLLIGEPAPSRRTGGADGNRASAPEAHRS